MIIPLNKKGAKMNRNKYNQIKFLLTFTLLVFIVSSCSVMNPHKKNYTRPAGFNSYTIENGVNYADSVIEAYLKGMVKTL